MRSYPTPSAVGTTKPTITKPAAPITGCQNSPTGRRRTPYSIGQALGDDNGEQPAGSPSTAETGRLPRPAKW